MADTFSKQKRSQIMQAVKQSNTKPEMIVRKFLFANGFRYRLHDGTLAGRPDIKLLRYKTIILIHGCFWHGHQSCKNSDLPKSNIDYWTNKIEKNKKRDADNVNKLQTLGWTVLIIWECELKKKILAERLDRLKREIKN